MQIENTTIYGFKPALIAMRNSWDSWDKSDTDFRYIWSSYIHPPIQALDCPTIGPKDMELCRKLIKGGPSHRKFLRQITIWVDFTLPRYVWAEVDTYHCGTVRNSCSTMHTLANRNYVYPDDFEGGMDQQILDKINFLLKEVRSLPQNRKKLLLQIKRILPESFLQKSSFTMNYETAMNMYWQRRHHELPEWSERGTMYSICRWIQDLPYMSDWLLPPKDTLPIAGPTKDGVLEI
jgi:hypothetical protein